jgi:transposase
MGRPAIFSAEEKLGIVLAVLAGEMTIAQAADKHQVSQTSIGNWKRRFLEAGRAGLEAAGAAPPGPAYLARLAAQNDALKARLDGVRVLTRVWRMSARHHRNSGG